MLPVAIDTVALHDLRALGARAPVVLTTAAPHSPDLRYRLRADRPRPTWLKIALRARITVRGGSPQRSFAEVSALADGLASASIELKPKGNRTWFAAAGLHSGSTGVTARRTFRIAYTNYVRSQASVTGRHRLRFVVRRWHGFRVERVVVERRSGLFLTHQPPQPLKATATLQADPAAIRVDVTNGGVKPARQVRFMSLADDRVLKVGHVAPIARIAPGATTTVLLPVTYTGGEGQRHVQVLASSDVGEATADLNVPPLRPPS